MNRLKLFFLTSTMLFLVQALLAQVADTPIESFNWKGKKTEAALGYVVFKIRGKKEN